MKISELFSEPSRWTQHTYARDAAGRACSALSSEAVCWCLTGALMRCYGSNFSAQGKADEKLRSALSKLGETRYIVKYNDEPSRAFSDIKRLVKKAGV